jgi:hypothetical protein
VDRRGKYFYGWRFRQAIKGLYSYHGFLALSCDKKRPEVIPSLCGATILLAFNRSIFMPPISAKNNPTASDWGCTRGIRAIRFTDNREECERRLEAFGLFARTLDANTGPAFALRIARALRAERRAAQEGGSGYDPMRHLVLTRLDRRLKQRRRKTRVSAAL